MSDRNLLLVEPAIRIYKEPILASLAATPGTRLFAASGLMGKFDYEWVRKYARHLIPFSYRESNLTDTILAYQKAHAMTFHGVVSYVDPSLVHVNRLAHALGVPVVSAHVEENFRHKGWVRDRLAEAGIVQPRYWRLRSEADLEELLSDASLPLPLILKPAEMMSSLGVIRIGSRDELIAAFRKVQDADFWEEDLRDAYGHLSNEVLCEELIEGSEYSAELIIQSGRMHLVGITKKWTTSGTYFDELAHEFPAPDLSPETVASISRYIEAAIRPLALRDTFAHFEFRLCGNQPYVIEINCRMGGDLISKLIERRTGTTVGQWLSDLHFGRTLEPPTITDGPGVRIDFLSTHREGRVLGVPQSLPRDFVPHVAPGDILCREGLLGASRLGHRIGPAPGTAMPSEMQFGIQAPVAVLPLPQADDTLIVFQAKPTDLDEIDRIERASWSGSMACPKRTLERRLRLNPEGAIFGYSLKQRRAVGFIFTLPLYNGSAASFHPWSYYAERAADEPYFAELPGTDSMHIVSISVAPDAPRGTGSALVRALAEKCRQDGIERLHYGIRVPGYSEWSERGVDFETYYSGLHDGAYHEPLFKLAKNAGGSAVRYFENYYEDPESKNYGIIIEHRFREERS